MVRLIRITHRRHNDVLISFRDSRYKNVLYSYFRQIDRYSSLRAVTDTIFLEFNLIMQGSDGRFVLPASDGDYYIVDEDRVKSSK
jgi:hypothetical protein